jgi:hypothetical protein
MDTLFLTPKPKKVTAKNLEKFQQDKYLQNVGPMLDEVYTALRTKVKDGNMRAIEMALQVCNLVKGQGGVTVLNQIVQNNNTVQQNTRGFAALVRSLDSRDMRVTKANDFIEGEVITPDGEID